MSHLPVVTGMSNQWLRKAMQGIAAEHALAARNSPALAMALEVTQKRIDQVTYVASVDTSAAVESLIQAAKQHGEDSDPDHEVGDLQDLLRAVWRQLTPAQRSATLRSEQVSTVLEGALQEPLARSVEDTHDWQQVCEFYGLDTSFQYGEDAVLEFTNMFRLDSLQPERADRPRYVHGTWEHIFHAGRPATPVRLLYDRQEQSLVAMELRCTGGWTFAKAEEIADVEDSLKHANAEALENPAAFGLNASAGRPRWCAEEVRRLVDQPAYHPHAAAVADPITTPQRERG